MSDTVSAGYGELLDSIGDALDVAEGMAMAFKDGFQIWDLAKFLELYPKGQEIFNDRNKIKEEILDLDADEAKALYQDLAKIRGGDASWIERKVLQAIDFAAEAYEMFEKAKTLLTKGKALIA